MQAVGDADLDQQVSKHAQRIRRTKYIRLPVCDLLFCIFSLLLNLSTIFSLLFAAFYLKSLGLILAFYFIITLIASASIIVAFTSLVWYLGDANGAFRRFDLGLHVIVHILQFTLVWRHYLFFRRVPEHATKLLFCELILLRLIHTTILCLPSCLLLFFVLFRFYDIVTDIDQCLFTAASLALFDFCFTLSTYNRRIDRHRPDLLVLCWPSILCQLCWRLGTVGARCVTLAIYASSYLYFSGLVIGLHWVLMCLCLFLFTWPKRESSMGHWKCTLTRVVRCSWLAAVYVVCFINDSKENAKWGYVVFYGIMFAENSLLLVIWLSSSTATEADWIRPFVLAYGWAGFAFGIIMALVYYKYAHLTKLMGDESNVQKRKRDRTVPSSGAFACQLPRVLAEHSKKKRSVESGYGEREETEQSGRRCNSVPSTGRYRPSRSSLESISQDRKGSRSLPRRRPQTTRRSIDHTADTCIGDGGSRSTFIETAF